MSVPRQAREKSENGIYHIMIRGINRQNIFEDEEDYSNLIQTLERYKEKSGYEIYAYCLMGNHVHLLIKIGEEPLEQIMRRICGSYVYWYNRKYQRIGNLFQDRFKSEAVDNDAYFLSVLRYIHQNPLKAGLVNKIEEYKWSSIGEYNRPKVIEPSFALQMFDSNKEKAKRKLVQYCSELNNEQCLDIDEKVPLRDAEAQNLIKRICRVEHATDLQKLDKSTRNSYLKALKEDHQLSIRQIARLTGINRGVVLNA